MYQKVKEKLNNTKGMENRTLEMTSAAGTKYMFVEFEIFGTVVNAYSWFRDRWNRLTVSFKSLEEAQEWIKELDRKYEAQKNAPKVENTMPTSAYYSITGYYGD